MGQKETKKDSRCRYKFYYTDGEKFTYTFPSKKAMEGFAHLEGDHLVRYEKVETK